MNVINNPHGCGLLTINLSNNTLLLFELKRKFGQLQKKYRNSEG